MKLHTKTRLPLSSIDSEPKTPSTPTPFQRIKPLPESFEKQKWNFQRVRCVGNAYIYRKTKLSDTQTPLQSWEVIKTRDLKAHPEWHRGYDRVEAYPSSEEWGVRAWTYMTQEDAERRFQTLLKV